MTDKRLNRLLGGKKPYSVSGAKRLNWGFVVWLSLVGWCWLFIWLACKEWVR